MDVIATLIELKPRASGIVDEWTRYVREHRAAAEAGLRTEGVSIESWFQVSLGGKDYLVCYMRAAAIETAEEIAAASDSPVDQYHREFKRNAWASGRIAGRLLLDLRGVEDGAEQADP